MIQINLLSGREGAPKKAPRESTLTIAAPAAGGESNAVVLVAGLVFIVGLVGLVLWGYFLKRTMDSKAQELNQKKIELKSYEGLLEMERKAREQKELLERKRDTILALKDGQSGPVKMLEEVFNRCPDSVWFEDITQKGATVTIKGRAKNTEAANQFYQDLSQSPIIRDIEYPLLQKDEKFRIPNVVYFEIVFNLNQPAGAAAGS